MSHEKLHTVKSTINTLRIKITTRLTPTPASQLQLEAPELKCGMDGGIASAVTTKPSRVSTIAILCISELRTTRLRYKAL